MTHVETVRQMIDALDQVAGAAHSLRDYLVEFGEDDNPECGELWTLLDLSIQALDNAVDPNPEDQEPVRFVMVNIDQEPVIELASGSLEYFDMPGSDAGGANGTTLALLELTNGRNLAIGHFGVSDRLDHDEDGNMYPDKAWVTWEELLDLLDTQRNQLLN